jgi:hypothetical protein
MTVIVDPKIQEQYDRNVAEHRANTAKVGEELKAKQQEIADQVAANKAADAKLVAELQQAGERERGGARHPSAAELEEHDISSRAEDYQEPEEGDIEQPPPPPPPASYRPPAAEEEEEGTFRWDDDVPPPRQDPRDADEDLSEHDWLE